MSWASPCCGQLENLHYISTTAGPLQCWLAAGALVINITMALKNCWWPVFKPVWIPDLRAFWNSLYVYENVVDVCAEKWAKINCSEEPFTKWLWTSMCSGLLIVFWGGRAIKVRKRGDRPWPCQGCAWVLAWLPYRLCSWVNEHKCFQVTFRHSVPSKWSWLHLAQVFIVCRRQNIIRVFLFFISYMHKHWRGNCYWLREQDLSIWSAFCITLTVILVIQAVLV